MDKNAEIKKVLEDFVQPNVREHGGEVVFESFDPDTGIVKVELQGSCVGCPASMVTLKMGIERLLTHMIPEVKEVINTSEMEMPFYDPFNSFPMGHFPPDGEIE